MRTALIAIFSIAIALTGNAFAQPFTPTMASDSYGIAQGGANDPLIATPKDNNDSVPDINDAINQLLGTTYDRNSDVDFLRLSGPDATWTDLSTEEADSTFVLIGLTAANANTLRVYDVADPSTYFPVIGPVSGFGFTGTGTNSSPYLAGFSPISGGTDFGWNLLSTNGESHAWDSNVGYNDDRLDHMLTYQLSALSGQSVYIKYNCDVNGQNCTVSQYTFNNPYLLAWEDKALLNGKLGDEDYDDTIYLVDRVQPVIPEPLSMVLFGSGLAGLAAFRKRKNG